MVTVRSCLCGQDFIHDFICVFGVFFHHFAPPLIFSYTGSNRYTLSDFDPQRAVAWDAMSKDEQVAAKQSHVEAKAALAEANKPGGGSNQVTVGLKRFREAAAAEEQRRKDVLPRHFHEGSAAKSRKVRAASASKQ